MQVGIMCSDTTFLMYDTDYPSPWGLKTACLNSRPGRRDYSDFKLK
jgi:hypothetical protein